ncbi:MAG: 3-deoxy-manno-octulosonate cytidylyltransferase [Bauldia sp.]
MTAPTAVVIIPARMAANRLPGKPLADIAGVSMVVRVWRLAVAAGVGPVAVATPDRAIADAVAAGGGTAVMTGADHLNGSSRCHEAAGLLDDRAEVVVNLQADMPTVAPETIRAAMALMTDRELAIGTACAEIADRRAAADPNVVKVVGTPVADRVLRCLYFTRATAPFGPGPLYQHIGIYAWRRSALDRYVALPPSPLETRERLEQLRALEAGMRIDAAVVDEVPPSVDTPADLERVRQMMAGH